MLPAQRLGCPWTSGPVKRFPGDSDISYPSFPMENVFEAGRLVASCVTEQRPTSRRGVRYPEPPVMYAVAALKEYQKNGMPAPSAAISGATLMPLGCFRAAGVQYLFTPSTRVTTSTISMSRTGSYDVHHPRMTTWRFVTCARQRFLC